MKICVLGLWHLGSVTSACLASVGHEVVGLDEDVSVVESLRAGKAPIFEPGLERLLKAGITSGKLRFSTSHAECLSSVDVLWVAFDTPVDEEDQADSALVLKRVKNALPCLPEGAVVLVSSQMPVGSIRILEKFVEQMMPRRNLTFACSPENLRLGKALDVFLNPDRIVVGVREKVTQEIIQRLLVPIVDADKVEWMSVESAEMTKHSINAFLALSVTFANEIATICEAVGADAKEVERGLKTDVRIGKKAYLSPGGPFAGGTLARDLSFLGIECRKHGLSAPLLSAVRPSNDLHKLWVKRKLKQQFGTIRGLSVAIWGLTYKAGTDTLRRSLAVELCDWLLNEGALVRIYEPAVEQLPDRWAGRVTQCATALESVKDVEALVVGTEWPEFKQSALDLVGKAQCELFVVDANRHIEAEISQFFEYVAVGARQTARFQCKKF